MTAFDTVSRKPEVEGEKTYLQIVYPLQRGFGPGLILRGRFLNHLCAHIHTCKTTLLF